MLGLERKGAGGWGTHHSFRPGLVLAVGLGRGGEVVHVHVLLPDHGRLLPGRERERVPEEGEGEIHLELRGSNILRHGAIEVVVARDIQVDLHEVRKGDPPLPRPEGGG